MVNILNLPQWRVLAVTETDGGDYRITAEYERPAPYCPKCGVMDPRTYPHSYHDQLFNDVPHHNRRTALIAHRRRYKCLECSKTFMQELFDVDESHRATKRLIQWVGDASLTHTFAHVARLSGFDERTVRRIFEEHAGRLEHSVQFVTPRLLGLDEVHLIRTMRCVLANLEQFTVVDMLPDRGKARVTQALYSMPNSHRVEVVAMDMYRPYRDAVHEALPEAVVVVDKFHVVRMASDAMEAIRKGLKATLPDAQRVKLKGDRYKLLRRGHDLAPQDRMILQAWFATYPELGEAYRAKEALYQVYDAADRREAGERLEAWRRTLPAGLRTAFKPVLTATRNWEEWIMNYFDHRATNAATEALNGAIKRMNSEGRGYSFRALRAKILYGKPHKKGPTSIRSMPPANVAACMIREPGMEYVAGGGIANYGVPFHTLGDGDPHDTSDE